MFRTTKSTNLHYFAFEGLKNNGDISDHIYRFPIVVWRTVSGATSIVVFDGDDTWMHHHCATVMCLVVGRRPPYAASRSACPVLFSARWCPSRIHYRAVL